MKLFKYKKKLFAWKPQRSMDLMSAICSSDYNQPNSRSTSLKSRTQSKSINKAAQMAHTTHSSERLQNHRFGDYFNCCDDKVLVGQRLRRNMCWEGILVFSVIVLINIASVNCAASRQLEGESTLFFTHTRPYLYDFEFWSSSFRHCAVERNWNENSVNWNLSQMEQNI